MAAKKKNKAREAILAYLAQHPGQWIIESQVLAATAAEGCSAGQTKQATFGLRRIEMLLVSQKRDEGYFYRLLDDAEQATLKEAIGATVQEFMENLD